MSTSPVRVLAADMGLLRVTVEGESHWTPPETDDHSSGDEMRCHSLDEFRFGPRRTNGGRAEDRLADVWHHHHRGLASQLGPRSLAFRRVASPARLHLDAARLRPRSSSGGRRSSDTDSSVPDGGPVGQQGPGHGQSRVLRLSRDATQPNTGSVSDLRGSQDLEDDDEESDVLPALGAVAGIRPRAYTCPDDIKAMQRRTKVRLLNRPPTPTPGDELDPGGGLGPGLIVPEKLRCRSNSGEIFAHNGDDDPLPVISET